MSSTIIAVIVQLLAVALPKLGITLGNDALTTTAETLAVIGAGLWIWYQRTKKGDVTALGFRK